MSDQPKRFFDLWFVQANTVTKEVPFHVVTDWVQQGRAVADDKVKPSGTAEWYPLGDRRRLPAVLPQPARSGRGRRPRRWHRSRWTSTGSGRTEDEDDDVDMIPLIDISLVLLIFFMMTMTVAAMSRIQVPDMANAITIETNPGVMRIDIDCEDGKPVYSLGLGTQAPTPEDDNLASDVELMIRLDDRLRGRHRAAEGAHRRPRRHSLRGRRGSAEGTGRQRVKARSATMPSKSTSGPSHEPVERPTTRARRSRSTG